MTQIMKFFIIHFYPTFCCVVSLIPNSLLSLLNKSASMSLLFHDLNLFFSQEKSSVLTLYKTTGGIIAVLIKIIIKINILTTFFFAISILFSVLQTCLKLLQ
jgi:hypothetical protein